MSSKEGDGVTLTWHDGDTSIDAQWQGIDEVGAVALLDQLRWRTADPMDGFEVTPGGTASIVDEGDPAQVTHQVELVYAPKPGTEVDGVEELRIITGAGDGSSWDTVLSEFFGSFTDGRNSAEHQTDPDLRQLEVASPGRLVRIDAGSSAVTDAQLQAIADSLVPTDEAGLRALERRTPGAELANDPPPTSSTTSAPYDPTLAASPAPLSVPLEQADGSGSATLAELADGRPLAVVLWQTYCVPCIQYLQALDEEAAAHPDRAVVAVATQDTAEQVGTFVRESGLDLPVLLDPEGAILDGWNVSVVPYTVFTNEQGQVETGAPGALSDNDEGQYFLDEFFNG
jgi:thiol-disulfide isomerase/thioredoxin